jgi:hypothetical protein
MVGQLSRYSNWLRARWPGFNSWQGQVIFPLPRSVQTSSDHTQLPVLWVPGARSQGKSGRGLKLTTHLRLVSAEANEAEVYLHFTLSLLGMVRN